MPLTRQRLRQRAQVQAFRLRDQISRLSREGYPDTEIAIALSLPLRRIIRERESLGIPPGGTTVHGITWAAQEDDVILDLRNSHGKTWVAIAAKLVILFGIRRTSMEIRQRYAVLMRVMLQSSKNGAPCIRACLTCGEDFVSIGKHDRICDECEGSHVGFDPVLDSSGAIPAFADL